MKKHNGFTLIEIAIVLLIISIILGYTLAMAPRQLELKEFKQTKQAMIEITDALYAFAQVKGYLPCPALVASDGLECRTTGTEGDGNCAGNDPDNNSCGVWFGFVPGKTLGLVGNYNADGLLQDSWNKPYKYHVTKDDDDGDSKEDFVMKDEIKDVGMDNLGPDLKVCTTVACATEDEIIDNAPVIILSTGKNRKSTTLQDANDGTDKDYVFTSYSKDFDDVVRWISPNILYSKMIEAGQLP